MNYSTRSILFISLLAITIIALIAANLLIGSVHIPPAEIINILLGKPTTNESAYYIIWESRIPQCITAILCGAGLSASGLMLQTIFNNPLADPSILGISSGSSLGVAIVLLAGGSSLTVGSYGISGFLVVIMGALIGAAIVLTLILLLSTLIRSNIMLLIAGIMIGYLASSVIALLNFFATAEGIQSYMIWGLGNFSGVNRDQLPFFIVVTTIGLLIAIFLIKPLNVLLLGPRYAQNLGVNTKRIRYFLLFATGILVACITSFCGPISFIGLAVPHMARLALGSSNHQQLMPATLMAGAVIALLCNLLCILPEQIGMLPLNAVTPLIGAPIILYIIINRTQLEELN